MIRIPDSDLDFLPIADTGVKKVPYRIPDPNPQQWSLGATKVAGAYFKERYCGFFLGSNPAPYHDVSLEIGRSTKPAHLTNWEKIHHEKT
jgi:hypothetical protein